MLFASQVKLSSCQRIVLLNYNKDTKLIDLRHYSVRLQPVGVSRRIRKFVQNHQVPDLRTLQDVSDFVTKYASSLSLNIYICISISISYLSWFQGKWWIFPLYSHVQEVLKSAIEFKVAYIDNPCSTAILSIRSNPACCFGILHSWIWTEKRIVGNGPMMCCCIVRTIWGVFLFELLWRAVAPIYSEALSC